MSRYNGTLTLSDVNTLEGLLRTELKMATTSKPGPQPVEKPLISPQAIAGASVHIEDSEIEYTEDTKKARNVQVSL